LPIVGVEQSFKNGFSALQLTRSESEFCVTSNLKAVRGMESSRLTLEYDRMAHELVSSLRSELQQVKCAAANVGETRRQLAQVQGQLVDARAELHRMHQISERNQVGQPFYFAHGARLIFSLKLLRILQIFK
jgi:hypothetical protein